jgi:hypothetical protein
MVRIKLLRYDVVCFTQNKDRPISVTILFVVLFRQIEHYDYILSSYVNSYDFHI